jgi:hypoxanthine phosphoribosyltransferase
MLSNKKRVPKMYKVSWKEFDYLCECLAEGIRNSGLNFRDIYGVPRGGLCLAVKLSHMLDIPLLMDVDDIDSETLTVDDLTDSGKQLRAHHRFCECKTATLYHSKDSIYEPDFWVKYKPEGWVQFPWETKETTK